MTNTFPYAENTGLRCSIYDGNVNNSGWSSWDIRYRLYPLRYSDLFGMLMKPQQYNSMLVLITVLMFAWLGVAASAQSDRRAKLTEQNTLLCKSKTSGEFIANSLGCFIKVE